MSHCNLNHAFLGLLFLTCALRAAAGGVDYFVAQDGQDDRHGLTRGSAFATIQRGVDALAPGDRLTILPGEYPGSVQRADLGATNAETVIRAEIAGTVVIRGDVEAPPFRPWADAPRVYVADFKGDVQAVLEVDTLLRLTRQVEPSELQFSPGSYHYDDANGKLFVSSSDLQPVANHVYRVAVKAANGVLLERPARVVLEGLAVTGFVSEDQQRASPGHFAVWGIVLQAPAGCTIRDCTSYLNGGGIAISASRGTNTILDCTAYGNYSPHSEEGGNIVIFAQSSGDLIRGCTAYLSRGYGMRLYGNSSGYAAIENSVGWGNAADFFVKGANVAKYATVRHSVAQGLGHAINTEFCYIGHQNIYQTPQHAPKDTIRRQREKIDENAEFADPVNFDFRLQSTSTFRDILPGGGDAGPYAFAATVYFLKPGGDDTADGLALATAWRTFARALRGLKPGDTLYIEAGEYSAGSFAAIGAGGEADIRIAARGTDTVTLADAFTLENARNLKFERLRFAASPRVAGGRALTFTNCRFLSPESGLRAAGVAGLEMTHCEFPALPRQALVLTGCTDLFLHSTRFNNTDGAAVSADAATTVRFSDYNSYADAGQAWEIDGRRIALEGLRPARDNHSQHVADPRPEDGSDPDAPARRALFAGRGALGKPIGIYQDIIARRIHMTAPEVYSVSATTANIEWILSARAGTRIAWGETPECEQERLFSATSGIDRHGAFSLTGLKPSTTYYFRIRGLDVPSFDRILGVPKIVNPQFQTISFTTAAHDPEPRTFHVAPTGDDGQSGLSLGAAWRTLRHAGATAGPGDTVLVGAGTYPELVRFRKTGEAGRPILVRGAPGQRVVLDSDNKRLSRAFVITSKHHIQLDALYLNAFQMGNWHIGAIDLRDSHAVTVARVFFDGRGYGYCSSFLSAANCEALTVRNCVIINGIYGVGISGGKDLTIEHSLFLRNMIEATKISTTGGNNRFRNNIVSDSGANKVGVWLHTWGRQDAITDDNNCYILRVPDEERRLFWIMNFEEEGRQLGHTRMSLAEYNRRVAATSSVMADPGFPAMDGVDLRNRFYGDVLVAQRPLDFDRLFTTRPELKARKIGLDPAAFGDFHFQKP